MTVPGIGPIISSAMVAAIGTGELSRKAATWAPGSGSCRNRYRLETARSSAAYRSAAIVICAVCSFKPPGSCWSKLGRSSGTAMGSSRGSRAQGNACTTTCWRLRNDFCRRMARTGNLCWPGPQGRETYRSSRRAAHEISVRNQFSYGQSTWPQRPAEPACACRRGDRIAVMFAACAHSRLWHGAADSECPLFGR